jgi:hypothetical protein
MMIQSGITETIKAAILDGTYLWASESMPIPIAKMKVPIKMAPRSSGNVMLKTFGPRIAKTMSARSTVPAKNREPAPISGGMDCTTREIPIYVEPQTIHKVISGVAMRLSGASVTPRTSKAMVGL